MKHKYIGGIQIQGISLIVVEDRSDQYDIPSVTNSAREITIAKDVEGILYKDSEGIWDAWIEGCGFVLLGETDRQIAENTLAENIQRLEQLCSINQEIIFSAINQSQRDQKDYNDSKKS